MFTILFSQFLHSITPNSKNSESIAYLKTDVIHFHVRQEVANQVFKSDYDKLGIHIPISNDQYNELVKIEGSKMNPHIERDDELVNKLKEILY